MGPPLERHGATRLTAADVAPSEPGDRGALLDSSASRGPRAGPRADRVGDGPGDPPRGRIAVRSLAGWSAVPARQRHQAFQRGVLVLADLARLEHHRGADAHV